MKISKYVSVSAKRRLRQQKSNSSSIVYIAIVEATVAKTAILDLDACPNSIIGIVVNNQVADSDYVEYLLQSL
jgi:type I restriction enzyme, S subunit